MENTDSSFWKSIFRMPFNTVRDTRIQMFQFWLIHRIIPYNEWLFKLRVKPSSICEYCTDSDSLTHFFINCEMTRAFWDSGAAWWLNRTGYNILVEEFLIKCLVFGFPGNNNNAKMINFCTLYAKYFIYNHKMKVITILNSLATWST